MVSENETPDAMERRIAEAAMRLAARRGWHHTDAIGVAREAGVPLAALYDRCPDRADLLAAVSRSVDRAVLADGFAEGETPRERLFDAMMRRFDALLPFRDGLQSVVRELPREPLTAAAFSCSFACSMAWTLRAAGIAADGLTGRARIAGLGALHARVMRVWLDDVSPDQAKTMAALDAELARVERWLSCCTRFKPAPGGETTDATTI